jgi:hypothetical protein
MKIYLSQWERSGHGGISIKHFFLQISRMGKAQGRHKRMSTFFVFFARGFLGGLVFRGG